MHQGRARTARLGNRGARGEAGVPSGSAAVVVEWDGVAMCYPVRQRWAPLCGRETTRSRFEITSEKFGQRGCPKQKPPRGAASERSFRDAKLGSLGTRWHAARSPLQRPGRGQVLRRLTDRRHSGCMATPQAHHRMSDRLLAQGRELREYAEKARGRSIALRASAEAARNRAVVLRQGRPRRAGAAFVCRGVFNPPPGLQSLQVVPREVECEAHAVQQLRALASPR